MNKGDFTDLKDRGRGSWKKDSPPALRRPYSLDPSGAKDSEKGAPSPIATSSLSVEAEEWYPSNYSPVPPSQQLSTNQNSFQTVQHYNDASISTRFSVQNRLRVNQPQEDFENHSNIMDNLAGSDSQVENFPISQSYNGISRFSVQDRLRVNDSEETYGGIGEANYISENDDGAHLREVIHHLITVMCEVTFRPGRFDGLCGPLVDSFASTLDDLHYTQPLVDAIVNQSISEPNFRYNGARLCSMYDSVAAEGESVFRSCLFERCAAEETKIIAGLETSENMRGFAMFLAELYAQLENPEGGRIQSLGERLCKILQHLINGDTDCIKSVCQILKLSGLALDADCPLEVDLMFIQLRRLAEMDSAMQNASLASLVQNILNLRINRWSNSNTVDVQKDIEIIPNGSSLNTNSYREIYMPDGLSLTAEESAFLQTHAERSDEDDEGPDNSDSDAWDTDMDPEMCASFVEFLKMSNQIKR